MDGSQEESETQTFKDNRALEYRSPLLTAGTPNGLRYPSGPLPLELFIISLPRETNEIKWQDNLLFDPR